MATKRGRPRKDQGTTFADGGIYYFCVKVRLPDGNEEWIKQTSGIPVGSDEHEAAKNWRQAEQMRRQAQSAENVAHSQFASLGSAVTVAMLVDHLVKERAALGVKSWEDDQQRLTDYWLPELGQARVIDVRTHHVIAALKGVTSKTYRAGKLLSQSTVDEAFRALKMLFDHAIVLDLREAGDNPCDAVKPLYRRSKAAVDPRRRKTTGSYTLEELARIVSDEARPPLFWRCVFACEGLAMLRADEAGRLRFKDWRPELENLDAPVGERTLGELWTDGQKTACPRWVPVHPALAALLHEWKGLGFHAAFGRLPQPDDLMFPYVRRRGPNKGSIELTDSISYKHLQKRLAALGLLSAERRTRAQHALRRAGNSAMLDAGVSEHDARKITHSPNLSNMSDRYDEPAWRRLSECVLKVRLPSPTRPGGKLLPLPLAAGAEGVRQVTERGPDFFSVSSRASSQTSADAQENEWRRRESNAQTRGGPTGSGPHLAPSVPLVSGAQPPQAAQFRPSGGDDPQPDPRRIQGPRPADGLQAVADLLENRTKAPVAAMRDRAVAALRALLPALTGRPAVAAELALDALERGDTRNIRPTIIAKGAVDFALRALGGAR